MAVCQNCGFKSCRCSEPSDLDSEGGGIYSDSDESVYSDSSGDSSQSDYSDSLDKDYIPSQSDYSESSDDNDD